MRKYCQTDPGFKLLGLILILFVPSLGASTAPEAENESGGSALQWDALHASKSIGPDKSSAEAWFTFTNNSSKPVEILGLEADCECMLLQPDQLLYYPGEHGVILARVDLEPGEKSIEKQIRVTTRAGLEESTETLLTVKILRTADEL